MPVKITIIGGGSYQWAPKLLVDLANSPALHDTEVVLQDIDPVPIPRMVALAEHIADVRGIGLTASGTTDRRAALEGADYVVVNISTGGFASMRHDLDIPARHGVRQSVGDTVGPGGIVRALRNIPVFLDIAADVEDLCPDAWLLNLTNPMTTICRALTRETAVKTVGLCHEVTITQFLLSLLLDVSFLELRPTVGGVNHLPFVTALDAAGADGLGQLRELIADLERRADEPLAMDPPADIGYEKRSPGDRWTKGDLVHNNRVKLELFARFGVLAAAGDRHLTEFFPGFLTEESGWGARWGVPLTSIEERERDQADDVTAFEEMLAADSVSSMPSGEMVAPVIRCLEYGEPGWFPLNIPNADQVADLPAGSRSRASAPSTVRASVDATTWTSRRRWPSCSGACRRRRSSRSRPRSRETATPCSRRCCSTRSRAGPTTTALARDDGRDAGRHERLVAAVRAGVGTGALTVGAVADDAEQLSAEYLTRALAHTRPGAVVHEVTAERIGTGQIGASYRLQLQGRDVPPTIVAKLAADDRAARERVKDGYRKEVTFYLELGTRVLGHVPRCWHGAITDDATAFTLLLDDLAPAVPGVQADGCTLEQAAAAVRNLAGIHAATWCDDALLAAGWLEPWNARAAEFLGDVIVGAAEQFVDRYDDALDSADVDALRRAAASTGAWAATPVELFAVVHGDYRLDNLMFSPDGPVVALDWQTATVGSPTCDLAYFLETSLDVELRRGHERELLTVYADALVAGGVGRDEAERCLRSYAADLRQGPLITMLGAIYADGGALRRGRRHVPRHGESLVRGPARPRDARRGDGVTDGMPRRLLAGRPRGSRPPRGDRPGRPRVDCGRAAAGCRSARARAPRARPARARPRRHAHRQPRRAPADTPRDLPGRMAVRAAQHQPDR